MKKSKVILFLFVNFIIILFMISCGEEEESSDLKVLEDISSEEIGDNNIVASNNELGFDVLLEIGKSEEENILISPMSLMMALSMVYNGASDETKEEIANTLHVQGMSINELNQANALLMDIINHTDYVQLDVANSIWLNKNFHFQKDFSRQVEDYFNAVIEEIDILQSHSAERINNWVKDATNEKIESIVEPPLDQDLVAILINALYFKGGWAYEFDKNLTEKRLFYSEDETAQDTLFMSLTERLDYFENDSFQAASLPYGEGEVSLNVFLPKKDLSLQDFKKLLTNKNWDLWKSEFQEKNGTIMLPKFQLDYEIVLNDALKALGMSRGFSNDAQFANMIKEEKRVKISEVRQKTFIDIDEEGTEAAAATSVQIVVESAIVDDRPFHMEVNRPFFFSITHNETGANLFLGLISNLGED